MKLWQKASLVSAFLFMAIKGTTSWAACWLDPTTGQPDPFFTFVVCCEKRQGSWTEMKSACVARTEVFAYCPETAVATLRKPLIGGGNCGSLNPQTTKEEIRRT